MPLLSVIIPAFNRADHIAATLQSVRGTGDLEIIVVDDGSTDDTVRIAGQAAPEAIILQQGNRGPGAARNLGLARATGKYAAFLDSDDLWLPWSAQTYAAAINQFDSPAFIAGKPFVFSGDARLPASPGPLQTMAFADYFASGDQWRWYSASSFVLRRDLFLAAGGFTDEWVNAEDADCALRMGDAPGFLQITSPHTFAYRQHAGSAMSNLDRSLAGVRRLVEQERSGKYPGGRSRALERRRIISFFSRPLCIELLQRGDVQSAWDLYRSTFTWNLRLGRMRFLAAFAALAATRRRAS